jgi:hypothetical protein
MSGDRDQGKDHEASHEDSVELAGFRFCETRQGPGTNVSISHLNTSKKAF